MSQTRSSAWILPPLGLFPFFLALNPVPAAAEVPQVSLQLKHLPKEVVEGRPAQLVIELYAEQELIGTRLHLDAAPGFAVSAECMTLETFKGTLYKTVELRPSSTPKRIL